MHTFTDSEGREWEVKLTIGVERKVHEAAGVYLSDLSDNATLDRLANESVLLADVLWAIVGPQAAERKIAKQGFEDALYGESLEAAQKAVIEETLDFLGHRGQTIRKARENRLRIEQELEKANLKGMEGLTGEELFQVFASSLAASTGLLGNGRESAESTPGASPGENSTPSSEAATSGAGSTQAA